jgi:hypothetical protein
MRAHGGLPGIEYPFTLSPDWSFRFSDPLVTLDGFGNIQSAVSEVNPADVLVQAIAADRPNRDSTTYRRPVCVGDAISDIIYAGVGFGASETFTSFVGAYAFQNVRTAAGIYSATIANVYWRHTPGSGAYRVWAASGGATASTSAALVAGASWNSYTKDPTAAGAEIRSRDSNGGDATNTPDRAVAGSTVAAISGDVFAGVPAGWSTTSVAWWIGYNRVLTATEHTNVANYIAGWL